MAGNESKGLHFAITADIADIKSKLNEVSAQLKNTGKTAEKEGNNIDAMFKKMAASVGAFFTLKAAGGFAKQVATVRGEFQQLEVAFTTMLGSKEKADKLMAQTVEFAAKTPFDLQGVANGTKQLLAYGSSSETVTDELRMLGNVASGLSIPLNDMVYLYGTTRTQGRLYTQDLRQFMGRGIPLAEELAKQFGVAKDEVGELVTAGKVGFPEVEKAIKSMTGEGGKFYNLMEEQSKTIAGKISNLGDAISQMFNEIGKESEDVISGVLDGAGWIVENYQLVAKTILEIVATYGTYKAVLITMTAVQRLNNTVMKEAVIQRQLAAKSNIQLGKSEAIAAARTATLTKAKKALAVSMKNIASMVNPYTLIAAGVAALAITVYKLVTYQTEYEKSLGKISDARAKAEAQAATEIDDLNTLYGRLRATTEGTEEYERAKDAISAKYGDYLKNHTDEEGKVLDVASAYDVLKQSIMDVALTKGYEEEVTRIRTEYQEKLTTGLKDLRSEIISDITKSGGTEVDAEAIYASIFGNITSGSSMTEAAQKYVLEAVTSYNKVAAAYQGGAIQGVIAAATNQYEKSGGYMLSLRKAATDRDKLIDDAKSIFQQGDTSFQQGDTSNSSKGQSIDEEGVR
jgi:tape measure domain-containing protein